MIHCYPGPMACSKTDLLIDAYHRYPASQVLAFNPASNTREDTIRSRTGRSIPSIRFERYGDIARRIYESRHHIRAVIVDENHMAARARGGPADWEGLKTYTPEMVAYFEAPLEEEAVENLREVIDAIERGGLAREEEEP